MQKDGEDAPWRARMTDKELTELKALEADIAALQKVVNRMSVRRQVLRNRAIMRNKYREKHPKARPVEQSSHHPLGD